MELESYQMPTAQYRAFLESVKEGWYVETRPYSDGAVQSGTVTEVLREIGRASCRERVFGLV